MAGRPCDEGAGARHGRTAGPRPRLLHPLRGAAEGLPRRGELGVPVSAVNAAAAWEFGMGAGSETPVEENPVGRGLFVMLDIASQHGSTDHLRDGPTG